MPAIMFSSVYIETFSRRRGLTFYNNVSYPSSSFGPDLLALLPPPGADAILPRRVLSASPRKPLFTPQILRPRGSLLQN